MARSLCGFLASSTACPHSVFPLFRGLGAPLVTTEGRTQGDPQQQSAATWAAAGRLFLIDWASGISEPGARAWLGGLCAHRVRRPRS